MIGVLGAIRDALKMDAVQAKCIKPGQELAVPIVAILNLNQNA